MRLIVIDDRSDICELYNNHALFIIRRHDVTELCHIVTLLRNVLEGHGKCTCYR